LEIADDAAVALAALPCPIVDADHVQGRAVGSSVPTYCAQQGILADRQHQAPRQRRREATTQGDAEMMDDRFKPGCAPRQSSSHRVAERFGKNPAPAIGIGATKSTNHDPNLNGTPLRRQIQKPSFVAAVQAVRRPPAIGALTSVATTSSGHKDPIGFNRDIIRPAGDNDRRLLYTMASIPQCYTYQI